MRGLAMLAVVASVGFTGCAHREVFTCKIRQQYDLTDMDLKRMQFFSWSPALSWGRMSWSRKVIEAPAASEDGAKPKRAVELEHYIVVQPNTPGVVSASGPTWVTVDYGKGIQVDYVEEETETCRYVKSDAPVYHKGQRYEAGPTGSYLEYAPDYYTHCHSHNGLRYVR